MAFNQIPNPKNASEGLAITTSSGEYVLTDVSKLLTAKDTADGAVTAPSAVGGDSYILNGDTTAVHSTWDGAGHKSHVTYDAESSAWTEVLPKNGFRVFLEDNDINCYYDGTAWMPDNGLYQRTFVDTSSYTVGDNDTIIGVDTSQAVTISLQEVSFKNKRRLVFKDETGNAGTNSITINAFAGDTIDGSASYTIDENYEAVTLYADTSNKWYVESVAKDSFSSANIYNSNGSLTANRTVTLADKNLIFSHTTGKIGVNQATPTDMLHVKWATSGSEGGVTIENEQGGANADSAAVLKLINDNNNTARVAYRGNATHTVDADWKDELLIDMTGGNGIRYHAGQATNGYHRWGVGAALTNANVVMNLNDDGLAIGNGVTLNTDTRLLLKGVSDTSSDYSLKATNNSGNAVLHARNDRRVGVNNSAPDAHFVAQDTSSSTLATCIVRFDHQNSTTPTGEAFAVRGTNLPGGADEYKFYVEKDGGMGSSSVVGPGTIADDNFSHVHKKFIFRRDKTGTKNTVFYGHDNDGGGAQYINTGIGIRETDSFYDTGTLLNLYQKSTGGHGTNLTLENQSISNGTANVRFGHKIDAGTWTNSGAGTAEQIGIYVDVEGGESLDCAALFLKGVVAIGSSFTTSGATQPDNTVRFHTKGDVRLDGTSLDNLFFADFSADGIGVGTNAPGASALLEFSSTTKAVRFMNMTTAQKNAIGTPTAGMVVYDTTLNKLCVYTTAWETITSV